MCSARHLGGDSSQRLTLQIGIVTIACNVALVLGSETVVALANGDLCRDPERTPKTRVAELGELRLAAELARLVGRQVEATELQELAVMRKRRKSPASARMVIAMIGPMPGICRRRR